MSETNSRGKEGLLEEAAAWFARMRGPDAEASRAEFERWLARGALHRAAYNRAAEVFAMGKLLADDHDDEIDTPAAPRPRHTRLVFGGIAAASTVIVGATVLALRFQNSDGTYPTSSAVGTANSGAGMAEITAPSGTQAIRLADNSLVRLERNASLAVQYGPAQRRLSLERGNARFYVAHEPRPFIVYAGGGFVLAHGTVFDVGVAVNRRVTVRLIQGVVDVTAPSPTHKPDNLPQTRRLHAGEAVSFASAPAAPATALAQAANSEKLALPGANKDAHDFRSVPLAELVRLANDGAARPIRIADEATAKLRISGKFRIDDTDLLAERIAALFNLSVDRSNQSEIVLRSK